MISNVINLLSILTMIGQAIIVFLLVVVLVALVKKGSMRTLIDYIGKNAITCALVVAIIATAGSLFLSEVAHFVPCRLCWFQRIFMYPQVVIYAIALWKKERFVSWVQGMALSIIGAVFASYHYYIQMFAKTVKPCSTYDPVSCTEKVVIHYGYITIPLMALTAFLMIILYLVVGKIREKRAQTVQTAQ